MCFGVTRSLLAFSVSAALFAMGCEPKIVEPSPKDPTANGPPTNPSVIKPPLPGRLPPTPSQAAQSDAVSAFLESFDRIAARGWVPTLRAGSTGVGYTLETLLGIKENNSPGGDFRGMELKAYRDDDMQMGDTEKMNLFLKEPKWTDGLNHAERIRQFGYVDDNGRRAMYSTVQIRPNSHGLGFRIDHESERLYMQFESRDVAYWAFSILAKRLNEKHSEVAFVAAHARGSGKAEEFRFYGVTWCCDPSIADFVELIDAGDVVLELRMHITPGGSVRNHGSAFRIRQNRIPALYAETIQYRP